MQIFCYVLVGLEGSIALKFVSWDGERSKYFINYYIVGYGRKPFS